MSIQPSASMALNSEREPDFKSKLLGLLPLKLWKSCLTFLTLHTLYGMSTATEVHQNMVVNTKYVNWPGSVSTIISSGSVSTIISYSSVHPNNHHKNSLSSNYHLLSRHHARDTCPFTFQDHTTLDGSLHYPHVTDEKMKLRE